MRPLPTSPAAPTSSDRRPISQWLSGARVRAELGLPISVGVARTKHLAKIASQVAKPDGLVVVDPATELKFLHDLPVELMWGVGPVTKARLAEIGHRDAC
jgi:nucleotidyltransferase/DNA polymerase involved in DNA repair